VSINVQPDGGTGNRIIGNNLLTSETGMREILEGGAGNDIIIGNRGSDILSGGAGADEFVYNSMADSGADPDAHREGGDNILDFNPAEDIIGFNFEVAPGRPVSIDDVRINTDFIDNGIALIGLSTPNTLPDFLPEQFVISLSDLDPTTTEADIRSRIQLFSD